MSRRWYFPPTSSPRFDGINAYEIDNKDSPLQTFVREVCQNSNDSAVERPMRIEFSKFVIDTKDLPDSENLRRTLEACSQETEKIDKNRDAYKRYQLRLKELNKPKLTMMRVSDFGTTGLSGSDSDISTTPWNSFTLGRGLSNKDASAGGSKGRGKDSINRMSRINTVFFSTLDTEGISASVGVSYQITHYDEGGQKRESQGFYGEDNGRHSTEQLMLDSSFIRKEPGTDIYVAAFDETDNDDYQIKLAVIRDFFVSIIEGKLVAAVNGTKIDENSIYSVLDNLDAPEEDQETIANIMELINCYRKGPKYSCKDYDIYLDKSEKFYRVASIRAGMTISREFHKLPHDNYMGLVIIRSNEASALLLKSEDISHNSWKPDVAYSEDRKMISDLIMEIKTNIRKTVNELVDEEIGDRKDAMGLNRYLPIKNEEQSPEVAKKEFLYDPIVNTKTTRKKAPLAKIPLTGPNEVMPTDPVEDEEENGWSGPVNANPEPRNTDDEPKRDNLKPGSDESFKRSFKQKGVKLNNLRTFCIDPDAGRYKILFDTHEKGPIYLESHIIVYDHDTGEKVQVCEATDSYGRQLNVEDCTIGPIESESGKRMSISIVINYPVSCRMTVVAHKIQEV